ncbi:MAG: hypothetical protein JWO59_2056 [Chloroflexi bacterium]|nr:hypothetical protein [Chloroflexota bacterium]
MVYHTHVYYSHIRVVRNKRETDCEYTLIRVCSPVHH